VAANGRPRHGFLSWRFYPTNGEKANSHPRQSKRLACSSGEEEQASRLLYDHAHRPGITLTPPTSGIWMSISTGSDVCATAVFPAVSRTVSFRCTFGGIFAGTCQV
jgi:hypothetical protein